MSPNMPAKSNRIVTISLFLVALSISALVFHLFKIQALERELAKQRMAAEASMAEKDAVNRALHKKLTLLDDQAALTQSRMAELARMEREVLLLTGRARLVALTAGVSGGGAGGQYFSYEAQEGHSDADTLHDKFAELLADADALRESYRQTISAVSGLDEWLRQTPILWPTDNRQINSAFGYRKDPFTGQAAHHNGLDIDGEAGDPVYAAADGIVQEAGKNGPHGRMIVIEHNDQFKTVYSHLRDMFVEPGQHVRQGEQIGEIGTSGRSTGPHLHYEVVWNGNRVDPRDYLLIGREDLPAAEQQEDGQNP